jgi:hypothetical protein
MTHTTNRTFICSVVFLDIVAYSQQPVDEQILLKNRFNIILAESIKDVAVNDRIILDTGDGAAISFLGDPEDALFVALSIRDAILNEDVSLMPRLSACIGINLGPVKLVQDINGQRNLIGDGINVAQRVMSFAKPGQVLVSRSYFEVISRLSQEYAKLFHYEGSRADKHVREHQVYSVYPVEKDKVPLPVPAVKQKEEQGAADDAGEQRDKTVTAEEGQPLGTQKPNARQIEWKKTLESWWVRGLDWIKSLTGLIVKVFNWNELRNNRAVLYTAAVLVVVLISIPVIIWKTGDTQVKDPGKNMSTAPGATPEAIRQPELTTPAPAPEEQKKPEPAATLDMPAEPATLSFGIAPWGEVYVDGIKKGVSPPLNNLQVTPGNHEIEIRNTTFSTYKKTVDLKPGELLKIKHKFL